MLKKFVDELTDVPEALHEYYTASETGGYVLDTDDESVKAMKSKISEFRSNNIELAKQKEQLEKQLSAFKDIDPTEIEEALKTRQAVKESELLPRAEIDKHLQKRLEQERKQYEKELSELTTARTALTEELSTMKIEKAVTESINRVGQLQKGALGDVLRRARMEIEVKENDLIERDSGLSVDPTRWAQELYKNCPYFFVPNSGIGAKGSGESSAEPNPWKSDSRNLTEQGRIYKESPEKAKRLAAAAGVNI